MSSEVTTGSTRETAIVRPGARVVLLDSQDRVLLIRSEWDGGTRWFTPGGALDGDESPEAAAHREVREETGIDPDRLHWGPCVWRRRWVWYWEAQARWIDTREQFFLARLPYPGTAPVRTGESEEVLTLGEARWWRLEDLRASGEPCSPERLVDLLEPLVAGVVPDPPLEIAQ